MARLGDLSSSVGRAGGRCWDRADRGLHSDAYVRPVACPALLGLSMAGQTGLSQA